MNHRGGEFSGSGPGFVAVTFPRTMRAVNQVKRRRPRAGGRAGAGIGAGTGAGAKRYGQLDLFPPPSATTLTAPTTIAAPAAAHPGCGSGGESNDMVLVTAVLAAADRGGCFLSEPGGCWQTGSQTDARTGTVALVETGAEEAAMVEQLVARGWLVRAARAKPRAGVRPTRASRRRGVDLEVHPVSRHRGRADRAGPVVVAGPPARPAWRHRPAPSARTTTLPMTRGTTVTTRQTPTEVSLSAEQRDALTDELFRLRRALDPHSDMCFCRDDQALVEAVRELREQLPHEIGDDELEPSSGRPAPGPVRPGRGVQGVRRAGVGRAGRCRCRSR